MTRMPVLFVSHGSPEIAVRETPAHRFLEEFGAEITRQSPTPSAILVVSAHWETAQPAVATGERPGTVHDFGVRFDRRLRDISYDAAGAGQVAERAAELIEGATGQPVLRDSSRGRDHGVWTPLHLLFPKRDVPVTQISIQPHAGPEHHSRIGAALSPLRDEGVLILASGAMTHNLSEFRGRAIDAPEEGWVAEFRQWMYDRIAAGDTDALLDYRARAPQGVRNHPDDEHLLPIFTALGAAGGAGGARIHASVEYGVIGMDVYRWE